MIVRIQLTIKIMISSSLNEVREHLSGGLL